ncbi:MAG: carbohydrate ABC transporter permease [Eubacteriales bacterium]
MKTIKNPKHFSIKSLLLYVFLILLAIITFMPFYFMIINATHSHQDIASGINWLPGKQLINNFDKVWNHDQINIARGFRNSLIISISTTALAAYFGGLCAYGFSKYKFKGNSILFWVVIGSMMFPPQLSLVGYYDVVFKLGWINNFLAIIIPMSANANLVFFVKLYIDATVPDSILESARIDGSSEFRIFNQIVLPMIKPSIATMSIFTFFTSWNAFIQPLIVFDDKKVKTIPLLVEEAVGYYNNDFASAYFIIALSMVPVMFVFAFASKYIIGGITAGAVKE